MDAIPRRNPDGPHAVLEVRILGWVSGGINCAIHGCYIPTAESCRERSESGALTEKPTAELLWAIKLFLLLFTVIWTLTLTGSACRQAAGGTQIKRSEIHWILAVEDLMTPVGFNRKKKTKKKNTSRRTC